jgi:tetratricopeptide (TPR) repeat protein
VSALYGLARGSKDQEGSRELFAKVRELKARSAGSGQANDLNTKGVQFMGEGHLDEALAAFRSAFTSDPNFAIAAYNVGVVLAQKGEVAEAAEAFRSAIRLRPGLSAAHLGLGLVLKVSGDPAADAELRTARMLDELERKTEASEAPPNP